MHNLFGERFYGHRTKAWHELGLVTQEDMTALEALTALGGGYWFEKRPILLELNGAYEETGDYAIVRSPVPDDPTERSFGYVTDQYQIVQPLRVCELFDENVGQPVETLGMLGLGDRIFLTWKLPIFDVDGDEIELYALISCGYNGKFGISLHNVYTRVVCQNTFAVALSESEAGQGESGKIWSARHNSINLERDFAIWLEHAQMSAEAKAGIMRDQFINMSNIPLEDYSHVKELLYQIYPLPMPMPDNYPVKLRKEKQEKIDIEVAKVERDVESVMSLYESEGTAIDATLWGLFNATVEYENWGRPTRRPPEHSIMMGDRANTMNKAFAILSDRGGK